MNQYLSGMDYLMHDFLGGSKFLKLRYVINAFKGLTAFYIVFLMWYFQNFSIGAYLDLTMHGSYGFIWVFKDLVFPDKSWDRLVTVPSAIGGAGVLVLYWCIDFVQIAGYGINDPSGSRIIASLCCYIFGVVLMMVTDCQKYYTLKYKKGLITEGMFALNRNPNYTGEMALYLGFAMITGNTISYCILFCFWGLFFYPFMKRKDVSFSKKAGWDVYKQRTYLCIWKVVDSDIGNLVIYCGAVVFFYFDYQAGGFMRNLIK